MPTVGLGKLLSIIQNEAPGNVIAVCDWKPFVGLLNSKLHIGSIINWGTSIGNHINAETVLI